MSRAPPSPDAPSAAITNNEVALATLAPSSPSSPASDQRAGVSNLFRDSAEIGNSNKNYHRRGIPPRRRSAMHRAVPVSRAAYAVMGLVLVMHPMPFMMMRLTRQMANQMTMPTKIICQCPPTRS
jgi:hypothetical protein